MHHYVTFQRYIYPDPTIAPPSNAVYQDERLSELSPIDFKDALRVTPRQFEYILHLIADHPVFLSDGPTPSADPAIQLKIALHRLGHNGTLASFRSLSRTLHCSYGSVTRYTRNCVIVLNDLQYRFLQWPNNRRKSEIKSRFGANFHFRDCIGCVDGTMIDFDRAPAVDRNAWATRKSSFSMGATGVCDHHGRFIHFSTGYLGTQYDSSAYKATTLYTDQGRYFSGEDYLLADAAYALSSTVIPRFKGIVLPANKAKFNGQHARARAKIEHAFGMLKGKWAGLQRLRTHLLGMKHIQLAVDHIFACVVLHNITRQEDLYNEADRFIEVPPIVRLPVVMVINNDENVG